MLKTRYSATPKTANKAHPADAANMFKQSQADSPINDTVCQPVTFHRIKLACRAQELTVVQHQPTYLFISVGQSAVPRALTRQLQWLHYYNLLYIHLLPFKQNKLAPST